MRGRRPTATNTVSNPVSLPSSNTATHAEPSRRTAVIATPARTFTPSPTSARVTSSAASRSSRMSRRSAASTIVTWEPRRAKACPSSQPMLPPPSTSNLPGSCVRPNTDSFVSGSASARPGTGGITGAAPVATKACRNRTGTPSTAAAPGLVNCADPCAADTPAARIAAGESVGSIAAIA